MAPLGPDPAIYVSAQALRVLLGVTWLECAGRCGAEAVDRGLALWADFVSLFIPHRFDGMLSRARNRRETPGKTKPCVKTSFSWSTCAT